MNLHERILVRKTAWRFVLTLLPLIAGRLFFALIYSVYIIDPEILAQLKMPLAEAWVVGSAACAAMFAMLQTRHPWFSPQVAEWCVTAGWDGRRNLSSIRTGLHWSDIVGLLAYIGIESFFAGQLSVYSFFGWVLIQLILYSHQLHQHGESATAALCAAIVMACIPLTAWPLLQLSAMVVFVLLLERAKVRATQLWARQATAADPFALSGPGKAAAPNVRRIQPMYGLRPDLEDPRPSRREALVLSGLLAWWGLMLGWARWLAKDTIPVDLFVVLSNVSFALMVLPITYLSFRRCQWYVETLWYPSPGFRARFAQRRPFVWHYDKALLGLLFPLVIGIDTLILPVWYPIQYAITLGVTAFCVMQLGPNPAHWVLTAPATMLTIKEGSSISANRRIQARST